VTPSRPARALELALFTAALLVAGLVSAALLWSGSGPYEDLARANGVEQMTFIAQTSQGGTYTTDLNGIVAIHQRWSSYVTGGVADAPQFQPVALFTADEYRHMADVRHVFDVARLLVPVGLFVMIIRLQRARARGPRDMWRLVRDGSLLAAGVVAIIGLVAVVAFEPLFLAFHYVFFPQGNFLFDPATSNIVRLYPDWYWEGITLRVGVSFVVAALALAALSALRLARRSDLDSPR
jgi:integral membrane protein (TIGR01906 family)